MVADTVVLISSSAVIATLAVVLLAGIVRGFSGFGGGLIYIPVAAAALGPEVAAATLLLYDIPASLPLTIRLLPQANVREVLPLALGSMALTPAGYWALTSLDREVVQWMISLSVLAGVILIASGWRISRTPGHAVSMGLGGVSGFLNGLAQIGGPPVILYWLSRATEPIRVRASAMLFFQIGTVATLATYLLGGLITRDVLLLSAVMVPIFAVGMICGSQMFGLATEKAYRRFAYGLIALSGIVGLPVWAG